MFFVLTQQNTDKFFVATRVESLVRGGPRLHVSGSIVAVRALGGNVEGQHLTRLEAPGLAYQAGERFRA